MTDLLVFTLRPEGTSLWLPQDAAALIGAEENCRLSEQQYSSRTVQGILADRRAREKGGKQDL